MSNPFIGPWTINDTSNPQSYPTGNTQTIRKIGDFYVVNWRVGEEEASFSPLFAESDVLLRNPEARGTLGLTEGTFNVEILILPLLRRLAASSTAVAQLYQVPGPLVGQWGAESTGNLPGEEEG
jgi:hypothetical protein